MGRAQRNPSVARDPRGAMGFAALYPSYGSLDSASTARTRARSVGSTSPSNHGLAMNQPTLRGLGCGSGSMVGMYSRQLRTVSVRRSEEHTSELQSLMRMSYAVFCLKKNKKKRLMNTQIESQEES